MEVVKVIQYSWTDAEERHLKEKINLQIVSVSVILMLGYNLACVR